MDLDLNREPVQAQARAAESGGSLLAELGDNHGRIEERIRLLEAVVARARLRPQLHSSSSSSTPISTSATETSQSDVVGNIPQPKPCKIDGGTLLIAEALAMDSAPEETLNSTSASASTIQPKPGGSIFDCNICFSLPKDPIITCCGHLFCWPCFYSLPNSDSYSSKECPVCQGEVLETDITPIYGTSSSDDTPPSALLSSPSNHPNPIQIPPRPRARRIDNVRQRVGYPPLPSQQRLTQIFVHPTQLPTSNTFVGGSIPSSSSHFSRLPSQPAGPFGETFAERIESHVVGLQLPRTQTQPLPFHMGNDVDNGVSLFPGFIPLIETNSMASLHPSPTQNQAGTALANLHSGNPVADGIDEIGRSHSSSSRRRRAGNESGLTFRNRRRRRNV